MAYLFLRLEKHPKEIRYLIPLSLFLVLSSEIISLLIIATLLFLLFNYVSDISLEKIQKEYLYFLLFFFLWSSFIIYKNAFLIHGVSIIWKNTPDALLMGYFKEITLNTWITSIGIFPFIFGSFVSFRYLFKKKSKKVNFFVSIFISSLILFISKLDSSKNSILFIGTSLIILFGVFMRDFMNNFTKTKLIKNKNVIYSVFFIALFMTQIVPGIMEVNKTIKETPNNDYFSGLDWIRVNTEEDSTILSAIKEGHRVEYFSKRIIIADSNFLLVEDIDEKTSDINTAFTSRSKIEVTSILEKYTIDYVFVSKITLVSLGIDEPKEILECLDLIYSNEETKVYKRNIEKCSLKRI